MNIKPKYVLYDIRRMNPVNLVEYTHENDVRTQALEVSVINNGEQIELSSDYTYTAAIVNRETKALINNSIECSLNGSGNVEIPIDNFHQLGAQDLLIELTITDSAGNQVLVTPFPLWIHVNASILDDAQVTPESQGTVPELLEGAKEQLERVEQLSDGKSAYEIAVDNGFVGTESQWLNTLKGADGFSPTATVTQTQSGATVTITDKNGTTMANISNGAPGQDYVLTAQDKSDIAAIVLSELPTTQGVLYGNTSN